MLKFPRTYKIKTVFIVGIFAFLAGAGVYELILFRTYKVNTISELMKRYFRKGLENEPTYCISERELAESVEQSVHSTASKPFGLNLKLESKNGTHTLSCMDFEGHSKCVLQGAK